MIEALLKAQEMQQETMHISANKEDSYTVDRPAKEHLEDGIKYELLANSPNRHTVAIGRVYSGDIAPNKPLPADHVWVYIEKAIDASYKLPVPIKNKETVGESKGKSLSKQFGHSSKIVASTVMPTHKPQLSNKYQTALDVYAKMYRSNPPVMNIQFDQGIYGTERVDMLSLELVDEVLNHEMTSIPVLSCYIRYLYDKFIIPRGLQTKFLFVSPHDVGAHANIKKEDFENQVKYLSDNFLSRADKETLFLVPYSQGDHWILIVIEPAAATPRVYYLDSLGGKPETQRMLLELINKSVVLYRTANNLTIPEFKSYNLTYTWKTIKCPRQKPNTVYCGYCLMRFMKEIVTHGQSTIPGTYYEDSYTCEYEEVQINEVIEEWC